MGGEKKVRPIYFKNYNDIHSPACCCFTNPANADHRRFSIRYT